MHHELCRDSETTATASVAQPITSLSRSDISSVLSSHIPAASVRWRLNRENSSAMFKAARIAIFIGSTVATCAATSRILLSTNCAISAVFAKRGAGRPASGIPHQSGDLSPMLTPQAALISGRLLRPGERRSRPPVYDRDAVAADPRHRAHVGA